MLLMRKCLVKYLNMKHGISSPTRGLIAFFVLYVAGTVHEMV